MKSPVVLIGVVLVVLAMVSVSAQGVYYVAADGSDTRGPVRYAVAYLKIGTIMDKSSESGNET